MRLPGGQQNCRPDSGGHTFVARRHDGQPLQRRLPLKFSRKMIRSRQAAIRAVVASFLKTHITPLGFSDKNVALACGAHRRLLVDCARAVPVFGTAFGVRPGRSRAENDRRESGAAIKQSDTVVGRQTGFRASVPRPRQPEPHPPPRIIRSRNLGRRGRFDHHAIDATFSDHRRSPFATRHEDRSADLISSPR